MSSEARSAFLFPPVSLKWFAVAALAFSASAGAARASTESAIQELLKQRHPGDSAQVWRSLGPDAPGVIMSLYAAAGGDALARMRLLQGLSELDDLKGLQFVHQEADRTDSTALRDSVIRSLAEARGALEIDYVAKFLKHQDAHTRVTAALALRGIGDPRAQALYAQYLESEKTPWALAKAKSAPAPVAKSGLLSRRVLADFVGVWRGFWVAPKPLTGDEPAAKTLPSLESLPATLTVELKAGVLSLREGKQRLALSGWVVKGRRLFGALEIPGQTPPRHPLGPLKTPIDIEIGIESAAGEGTGPSELLVLRALGIGATFTGRKSDPRQNGT